MAQTPASGGDTPHEVQVSSASGNPPIRSAAAAPTQLLLVQNGRWQRWMSWFGWTGFMLCGILLLSQSAAYQDYFDTTEGLTEKYHSGSKTARAKIAVLSIEGAILDGSGYVKQQIDRIRADDNVKAVVVRVVSPGGTISGSDYIYHHLCRLRDEKKIPLVVSMGGIAASGGYYVSMAVGDRERSIFAEPTTSTGSIGVIIPHYDISQLLERFDIKDDSIVSHPRKQILSMTRPVSPEDRALMQSHVNEFFERFKSIVREGRPEFRKNPETLNELATGEIFTADQAKRFRLVDEIGFIEAAIDRALEIAKLDKDTTRVVRYEKPVSLFDLSGLVESQTRMELSPLLDLATPRAYYLATTLPPLLTNRSTVESP